jgi:hypothetical protein
MSGSYTIGGSGANYASIESAVSALTSAGVNGAVTFRIASGTYTPPSGGYRLRSVTGMSSSNTVTFKPASGATVTLQGTTNQGTGVFTIDGGKYYIIDGSNSSNGTTRDMTIRQMETNYNPAVLLEGDADFNVIKNCNIQGNAMYSSPSSIIYDSFNGRYIYGTGVVTFAYGSTSSGNDSNTVQNNQIGDPTGSNVMNVAVLFNGYNYSQGSSRNNNGNKLIGNDIINFGKSSSYTAYGICFYYYNANTLVQGNSIHMTQSAAYPYVYGIYNYEGYSSDAGGAATGSNTFDGNRIYKLMGAQSNGYEYLYGIYNYSPTSTQTTTISNNMIALTESGPVGMYFIYLNGSGTFNLYNNSIYSGGTGSSSYSAYMLYRSGSVTTNHKNNIYYATRTGSTSTNYGLYISSSTGWTSDYNLININTASNYYTGYFSGARQTFANFQSGSGQETHSVSGLPQFIDQDNGDLHISTTRRTPVENAGTPISGITTDIDGNSRSSTTPDIGADEGSFRSVLGDDMASDRFLTPKPNQTVRAGIPFTPQAVFYNNGTNARTSVTVRFRIWNSSNAVVYNDAQTISSLTALTTTTISFNQSGNVTGNTTLTAGTYTIEMRAEYGGDADTSNDAIYGTISVKAPLAGTYTINPNGSGNRNYTTFTAALIDLNALGISPVASDSAVTFLIAGGTYDASTETFPLTLGAAPGITSTKNVTFKPMPSANVVLTGSSSRPIVNFEQGDYYVLDGSNSAGGSTRNWKIINSGAGPAMHFINGATYNVVKNTQIMSNNTASSYYSSGDQGGITFGLSNSTYGVGNSYNAIVNNIIGDTTGAVRPCIAVYSYGDYTYRNTANLIQGNEIVNFGNNNYAYGIVPSYYTDQVKIFGNTFHQTTTTNTSNMYYQYGIYYYFTYGANDTIAYNNMYDFNSAYSSPYRYYMYIYYPYQNTTVVVHDNVFNMNGSSGYNYGVYAYGGYTPSEMKFEHNTMNVSGSPSSSYYIYSTYNYLTLTIRNNIFSDTRPSSASGTYMQYVYGMYVSSTTDYNVYYMKGSNGYLGYNSSGAATTLSQWQSYTGQESHSLSTTVPYVDATSNNLHIDPQPVFGGEGKGAALGYPYDMDMQSRDANTPDIGADEGDFNGGGIRVAYPNGGEQLTVGYLLTVQYSTNRAMGVRIELSTNNGASWVQYGSVNPTAPGTNTFTFTTPDTVTSQALLRVISMKNQWEADTSDRPFQLVRPIVTVISPNGGERLVGSDTTQIQWSSKFVPPTLKVQIDYSTDAGNTWIPIATNLTTNNLPGTNSLAWIIPSASSTVALMRVKLIGSSINDVSDAYFTMQPTPNVHLLTPNGGEQLFVGEKETVSWTTITTDYLHLDYSTDGGSTWTDIVNRVPAYVGSFDWVVPPTVTTTAIVRATNVERPRFVDQSDGLFSILKAALTVTSPNGGEKYELNQPVTVTWNSANSTHLRLEYSRDNGTTWTRVAGSIPAGLGTFQFTPPAIPTTTALVRLVDEDRISTMDASDAPFSVQEPKSIVVYTPATNDELPRGGLTQITWTAPRIDAVNILYSTNGGSTWVTLASNVPSSQGSYNWNLPNVNTTQGKVRVAEVGGATMAETGLFSIVDPKVPFIQVISPNGGEKYSVGSPITIRWTDANISDRLAVSYSTDGGSTWTLIQSNIMPIVNQLDWKAPDAPSNLYRIKVASSATSDMSDANFAVTRQLQPKITLVYPNGGESVRIDTTITIIWTEQDLTATKKGDNGETGSVSTVDLSYSIDNGLTWQSITSVPLGTLQYRWKVPSPISAQTLVRVSVAGQATDQSDAIFEILPKILAPITVLTPNGGEVLQPNTPYTITFSAPADVVNVKIDLSRDGGQSWEPVIAAIPAASGSYNWITPVPMTTIDKTALIRVSDVADASRKDESDAPFSIKAPSSGVDDAEVVAGVRGIALIGNFPNPFASTTEIRWIQPTGGEVGLRIFQETGTMVGDLSLGRREAGQQAFRLDAAQLASGLYHYELRVGSDVARGVMLVTR